MAHSYSDKVNSLKYKVFESSLEWNIENFNEYSKRDLGSITSRKICIEDTDVYWILHVHPHGYHSSSKYDYEDNHSSSSFDDDYVSLSLQIKSENPSRDHCFKIEVKTDVVGLQMMSPHDFDESQSITAPHIDWHVEYENIDKRDHFELYKEAYIKGQDLHKYMYEGTLRLLANVSMKSLDTWDHAKADEDHAIY